MEYTDVLKHLAPCGLDCVRCADYEHGEIKQLSSRLTDLLRNYGRIAKMKTEVKPIFNEYVQFEKILEHFSKASCSGCRGDNVHYFINCAAKTCYKEKGVDFCFQCDEYPCEKQFKGLLGERFKKLSDRMKEIGIVEYYYERIKLPRY